MKKFLFISAIGSALFFASCEKHDDIPDMEPQEFSSVDYNKNKVENPGVYVDFDWEQPNFTQSNSISLWGIAAALVNRAACRVFDEVWNSIFGAPEVYDQASQTNALIREANKKLDVISQKLDLQHYASMLDTRKHTFINISNHNDETFLRLKAAQDKGDELAVKQIIKEWGDATVDGNPAKEGVYNIIDYLTMREAYSQKTYCEIYRWMADNSIAWSNHRNQFTISMNHTDSVIVAQNMILTKLYYDLCDGIDDDVRKLYVEKLAKKVDDYEDFLTHTMPKEYSDDKRVFGTGSLKLEFDTKLQMITWADILQYNVDPLCFIAQIVATRDYIRYILHDGTLQLNEEELNEIMKSSDGKTMFDILKNEGDFDVSAVEKRWKELQEKGIRCESTSWIMEPYGINTDKDQLWLSWDAYNAETTVSPHRRYDVGRYACSYNWHCFMYYMTHVELANLENVFFYIPFRRL